jgi:hypothetical protein
LRCVDVAVLEPDFLTPGEISLQDLLEIDAMFLTGPPDFGHTELEPWKKEVFMSIDYRFPTNTSNAGSYLYVENSIDVVGSSLAQVIIARGQQMIGLELSAEWRSKENSPGYVVASELVWSYNFEVRSTGASTGTVQ